MGLSVVVGVAMLLVAALLVWRLGRVANERTGDDLEVASRSWRPNRWSCHCLPAKMLPLTAIKIVVTVWQIVYQVCECWSSHETLDNLSIVCRICMFRISIEVNVPIKRHLSHLIRISLICWKYHYMK